MAWTTPKSWSAGEVGTASAYNTHIRDNLDAAAGANKATCRVYNSSNISIANATTTSLTFDSELWDRQVLHSTSSNTGRITVPSGWAGTWMFIGHVQFASNATGYRELIMLGNGSAPTASMAVPAVATGGASTRLTVSTFHVMAAGDYMTLGVYQNSGSALDVEANPNLSPQFSAFWLSA